jgi:hypothetical protein
MTEKEYITMNIIKIPGDCITQFCLIISIFYKPKNKIPPYFSGKPYIMMPLPNSISFSSQFGVLKYLVDIYNEHKYLDGYFYWGITPDTSMFRPGDNQFLEQIGSVLRIIFDNKEFWFNGIKYGLKDVSIPETIDWDGFLYTTYEYNKS